MSTSQRAVHYADLDLSQRGDVQLLYSRLHVAARKVCGRDDHRQLGSKRLYMDCYEHALSDAVAQVNRGSLTSLHLHEQRLRLVRRGTDDTAGG